MPRELIPRVRRASRRERDAYAPAVYAGAATLAAFACLFAWVDVGGPGAAVVRWPAVAPLVTGPYAFPAGLIRGRLSPARAGAELAEAPGPVGGPTSSLRGRVAAA